jgi:predicted ATPase
MSLPRTGIVGLEIFDVVLDDSTPIPSSRAIEAKLEDERTTTTTTLPLLRNSYFHKLLEERLEEFATTPKLQQPFVALQVLELWRIQSPGGRFLKYDSQRQVWKDVGDKKAREQIAKAFRHLLKQSNRRNCTSSSSTNEADNSRPQEESISSKTGSQRPLDVEVASISCSDSRSKTSNRELGLDDNGSVLRHPLLPPRSSLTQTKKTISSFIQQNMRTRRLYSRSSDHERLVQLYQESIFRPKDEHGTPTNTNQGKTNALIISGLPGVGKTSLAYSLESRVLSQNGLFIRTKLSRVRAQQEREEPLAPRKAILQDIIRTVMDQTIRNPALQQRLCQKIVKAAGEEMDLLCQVVTAMARLKLLYNSHVEVATATRKIHQPRSSWNPSEELSELTMSKERSQSLRRRSSTSDQFLHHEQVVKQPDKTKPSSPVVGTNTLSLRRFEYAFHKILKALASPDHPLVIVLDDYPISDLLAPNKNTINDHSIDLASSVRSTGGLFFIMTCRIDPEDPSESFETLERKSEHSLPYIQNHHLPLSGLPQEAIHELLVDALSLESSKLELLSQTVSDLTKGNVLFVLEILRAFQDDELLRFDEIRKQWVCDDHLIRQHSILQVQSLKDLYRNKLMEQTTESQEVLKICACLGLEFRYDVLRMVVTNRAQLDSTLSAAEKHGFLGQYKNSEGRKYYSFCHDLIYQAAYQLIPDAERESWHFQMGQKLWNKARDDDHDLDAFLFVILEQLFAGEKLIRDMDDRIQVASLCLHAGEAMVKTSVFELSTTYLLRGIGLLGPTKFRKHNTYDLCLALHNNAIDTCYATGQMDTTEELIQVVLDNARVFEDEIRARIMLIYTRGTRRELDSAIHLGVETLARLGEKLDSNPSKWNVLFALVKTRRLLRRHSNLFLENLPATTNERILSVQIVLNVMWLSAYYSNPLLAALIACRMVQLSVNHGVSNVSSVGFAMFATNILRYVKKRWPTMGICRKLECSRFSLLSFLHFYLRLLQLQLQLPEAART